jgi:hypothetical protein
VAWANQVSAADRKQLLDLLQLPENTGPASWWLTEFEDHWPYRSAPADVYFSPSPEQAPIHRPPVIEYTAVPYPTDITAFALGFAVVVPPLLRRARQK